MTSSVNNGKDDPFCAVAKLLASPVVGSIPTPDKYSYELHIIVQDLD